MDVMIFLHAMNVLNVVMHTRSMIELCMECIKERTRISYYIIYQKIS